MRWLFLGILLVSLVFISGCIDNGFPVGGKYCKAIGLCNVEEKEVEIPDVIVIKKVDIPLLKGGEITPNREVDILVTLKNKDADKPITLTYVGINPGIFSCNREGCISEEEAEEGNIGTINPGQEKTFSFKVNSPDNKGTMALEGHLEVSVKYKYTSTRLATITYVTKDTYIEYSQSEGKIPLDIINVPSDGPVELYLDISKIKQPIIIEEDSGTTPEGKYQIYLKVMNKGSGEIDKISAGSLTINFEEMELGTCSEEFGGEGCGGDSVTNTDDITIRGKKPFRYYFSFDPSSSIKDELLEEDRLTTTKKISAEAEYIYRISKKIDISVSSGAEY